jgi:diaminopimelate decarboxylase
MNDAVVPGSAVLRDAGLPSLTPLARGLVQQHFGVHGGELQIGGVGVRALAAAHGTPLYVYDHAVLQARYGALARAVEGFAEVLFSVKANPNPEVARAFVELGAGLEVASGAEFGWALAAGCAPEQILFAGPGKGEAELRRAVAGGIGEIHLEGFDEIELLARIAAETGRRVEVALRINPSAAAAGGAMRMGGKPAAFGFDEEQLGEAVDAVRRHPGLHLQGLHLYAGTQVLQADVLLQQWSHGLQLARQLAERLGRPLGRIDLGGGLGIPYHPGQAELDLALVQAGARALAAGERADPWLAGSQVVIEPGRWLSGPAGVYLMAVRAVKTSRGQRFVIGDGGMHHHLAASGNLGQVIKRDYPLVAATRLDAAATHPALVVGPLCTPLDTLGRETALPELAPGDLIAVLQSGAYGLTSSPVGFLGHPMPAEVLVRDGRHRLIRPAGSFEMPLVNLPGTSVVDAARLRAG